MPDLQVCATMNVHDLRGAVSRWVLTLSVRLYRIMIFPWTYPLHVDWFDIWHWKIFATVAKVFDRLKQNREDVIFFWRW